jgi:transcriptional regulator with XRE-family HTH domain
MSAAGAQWWLINAVESPLDGTSSIRHGMLVDNNRALCYAFAYKSGCDYATNYCQRMRTVQMPKHMRETSAAAIERREQKLQAIRDQGQQQMRQHDDTHEYDRHLLQAELHLARRRAGLTQGDAASLVGIDKSVLSRIENGVIENPRFDIVAKLCFIYNVSLDEIASKSGLPNRQEFREPSKIADPKLRVALHKLLSSPSRIWREHVITTLAMLVASDPHTASPDPSSDTVSEEDLWLAGLSDPDAAPVSDPS